jgi:hypothetical protein
VHEARLVGEDDRVHPVAQPELGEAVSVHPHGMMANFTVT